MKLTYIMLLVQTLFCWLGVSGQETASMFYKGRMAPQAPIVEPRDTSGIDPFLVANRIELLYYTDNRMLFWKGDSDIIENGELKIVEENIRFRVQLDTAQRADWQNECYEHHLCEDFMIAGCYEPRHLLVFFDKDNKALGGIEICVSCSGGWVSPGLRPIIFCPARTGVLSVLITQAAGDRDSGIYTNKRPNKWNTRKIH